MIYNSLFNASKRLPIAFCLDVSLSMNNKIYGYDYSGIDILSMVLNGVIEQIIKHSMLRVAAEVSIVTFADKIRCNDSDFVPINDFSVPVIAGVEERSTCFAEAVFASVQNVESIINKYVECNVEFYRPVIIIVTDGNAAQYEDAELTWKAICELHRYCSVEINGTRAFVPFVICVGNIIKQSVLYKLILCSSCTSICIDNGNIKKLDIIIYNIIDKIGNVANTTIDFFVEQIDCDDFAQLKINDAPYTINNALENNETFLIDIESSNCYKPFDSCIEDLETHDIFSDSRKTSKYHGVL